VYTLIRHTPPSIGTIQCSNPRQNILYKGGGGLASVASTTLLLAFSVNHTNFD
jgi:hypothetical protein